jgi:uncharacterized protein YjhX (UPF0386 family)
VNISKAEQRTLHALAQGGVIVLVRDARGDIEQVECLTREGWRLTDCTLAVFRKQRRRRLIVSREGGPYRITREGALSLRSQVNNRTTSRAW